MQLIFPSVCDVYTTVGKHGWLLLQMLDGGHALLQEYINSVTGLGQSPLLKLFICSPPNGIINPVWNWKYHINCCLPIICMTANKRLLCSVAVGFCGCCLVKYWIFNFDSSIRDMAWCVSMCNTGTPLFVICFSRQLALDPQMDTDTVFTFRCSCNEFITCEHLQ